MTQVNLGSRRVPYPEIVPYRTAGCASRTCTRFTSRSRATRGAAGGLPARRPRRRHRAEAPALLRSRPLPHRALRPARLRAAARRTPRSSDNTTWHLVADMEALRAAPGHRALAGVRRLVGQHARARLRRDAPRARDASWSCAASSSAQARDRLVLPARRQRALPRRLGGLPRADPRGERGDLLAAYHRRLTERRTRRCGQAAARAWSVWEGRRAACCRDPDLIARIDRRQLRPGVRAHRVPLLREPRLSAQRDAQLLDDVDRIRAHPGGDRAGALRRGVPDGDRLGAAPRVARGRAARRAATPATRRWSPASSTSSSARRTGSGSRAVSGSARPARAAARGCLSPARLCRLRG